MRDFFFIRGFKLKDSVWYCFISYMGIEFFGEYCSVCCKFGFLYVCNYKVVDMVFYILVEV